MQLTNQPGKEMNQLVCPKCGFKNRPNVNFCTECGNQIVLSSEREPTLTMLFGEGQELIFSIKQSRTTIGRDIENDIVLRDSKISKIHAVIVKENGEIWIEDLDSKNGVYVNGRKIEGKKKLMNGNLVKLGFTIFRFECG